MVVVVVVVVVIELLSFESWMVTFVWWWSCSDDCNYNWMTVVCHTEQYMCYDGLNLVPVSGIWWLFLFVRMDDICVVVGIFLYCNWVTALTESRGQVVSVIFGCSGIKSRVGNRPFYSRFSFSSSAPLGKSRNISWSQSMTAFYRVFSNSLFIDSYNSTLYNLSYSQRH